MKNLLSIPILLLSQLANSAEVDIHLGTDLTVGNIQYSFSPCGDTWDSGWTSIEVDPTIISSFRCKLIPYSGDESVFRYEGSTDAIEYLFTQGGGLKRITVSLFGNVSEEVYPDISNSFEDFIIASNTPYVIDDESSDQPVSEQVDWEWGGDATYVLDEVDDVVWKWDGELAYWKDLSTEIELPGGEYQDLVSILGRPILSIGSGENIGLWNISTPNNKLSSIPLEGTIIIPTAVGYMQLFIDPLDENYKIYWLGSNNQITDLRLSSQEFDHIETKFNETGALSVFKNPDGEYSFVGHTGGELTEYEVPEQTPYYKGCYSSFPRAFCVFSDGGDLNILFEVTDDGFRADTKLEISGAQGLPGPLGYPINEVVAIGGKRYFTTSYSALIGGPIYSMYVTDSESTKFIASYQLNNEDEKVYMEQSSQEGVINWNGIFNNDISITKINHEGSLEYIENDYTEIEGRDSEKEIPRAEIPGYYSSISLSLLLMVVLRRRPKY